MPATMRADITKLVKPWFDKGMQQGELHKALETARNMLSMGLSVDMITRATGLTEKNLRENKIISDSIPGGCRRDARFTGYSAPGRLYNALHAKIKIPASTR